jgi:tetratricopeptide (TPR) repeat protein
VRIDLAKTMKPEKPLRQSLASHRAAPEEEIRTFAARIQSVVEGREVFFFSILVAILLLLGGGGIYWLLQTNESKLAEEKLGVAYAEYRNAAFPQSDSPTAPPPAPATPEAQIQKAEEIERVAKEFPGTRAGAMASYLAGNAYLGAGKPDRAAPLLRTAIEKLPKDDPARPFAQSALAYALENGGRTGDAMGIFIDLSRSPDRRWKLEGLLGRARILETQGKAAEAGPLYTTIATEFPEEAQVLGLGARPTGAETASNLKVITRPIAPAK